MNRRETIGKLFLGSLGLALSTSLVSEILPNPIDERSLEYTLIAYKNNKNLYSVVCENEIYSASTISEAMTEARKVHDITKVALIDMIIV